MVKFVADKDAGVIIRRESGVAHPYVLLHISPFTKGRRLLNTHENNGMSLKVFLAPCRKGTVVYEALDSHWPAYAMVEWNFDELIEFYQKQGAIPVMDRKMIQKYVSTGEVGIILEKFVPWPGLRRKYHRKHVVRRSLVKDLMLP